MYSYIEIDLYVEKDVNLLTNKRQLGWVYRLVEYDKKEAL